MASRANRPRSDSTITMRLAAQTRELIDRAAAAQGKSRTEFMVESARTQAVDVLLDQRVFHLDAEATAAFDRALANPPRANAALKALMAAKPVWE